MSETSKRVLAHEDDNWFAKHDDQEQSEMVLTLANEVKSLEAERDAALTKLAEAETALSLSTSLALRAKLMEVERERDGLKTLLDISNAYRKDAMLRLEECERKHNESQAACAAKDTVTIGGMTGREVSEDEWRGEKAAANPAEQVTVTLPLAEAARIGLFAFLRAAGYTDSTEGGDTDARDTDSVPEGRSGTSPQVAAPADSTSAKGAGTLAAIPTLAIPPPTPKQIDDIRNRAVAAMLRARPRGGLRPEPWEENQGGHSLNYTCAEVDAAIAQAKREVLEAVADASMRVANIGPDGERLPGHRALMLLLLADELRKAVERG
jgi:hypothetical protein